MSQAPPHDGFGNGEVESRVWGGGGKESDEPDSSRRSNPNLSQVFVSHESSNIRRHG